MAQLTPDQIAVAKSWLHDIFVAGGIYPNPGRTVPSDDYYHMYGTHPHYSQSKRTTLCQNAAELCRIFKNRKVDAKVFLRLDELLKYFEGEPFLVSLDAARAWETTHKKASMLAKYLAWFCSEYKFYWDDSAASTYEMAEINNTIAGKALKSFGCFTSQHAPKATKAKVASAASTAGSTAAATPRTPGQPPQNNFKSRGALSGSAVDLKSIPGQKEYLSTPIYCVNGVDTNGAVLEDTAYIRPVEADPKSQAKYTINNTNKVLFGKAKGYGYCQVYFTSKQAADDFCAQLIASNPGVNPNVALIKVCQLKSALANGYFMIGTEFGSVFISASKLNESIQEAVQESTTVDKSGLSNKEKWERYEEAYFHEL
jgi:hypothetical protein